MNNPILLSLLAGFFFGTWPVIARFANLTSFWVAFLIPLGTLVCVAVISLPKIPSLQMPLYQALLIGLIAGACNGAGMLAYGKVLANTDWDVSKYVPIAAVSSLAFAAMGGLVLFKEPMTVQKDIGFLFAIAAIWLLG